ncbi:MAG: ParB/RepB/Spo0J family partition protein [Thermodesulfobacteria bacterium]|nr:ParB/RepB/Spo0J family partition protein [Thermodesulfobacteriota bacterium]
MTQKGGLGRGLSTLLSSEEIFEAEASGFYMCPIEKIRPNPSQPRMKIKEETLKGLADSIRDKGLIQPLVVSEEDGTYNIIAGERRWRAAQLAGLKKVPVIIKDYSPDEALEVALIENIQREDLNPIEEAMAYKRMVDELGYSQAKVAERVGKDRSTVANMIRLLNLPESIQQDLLDGTLTTGHAKALLMLEDEEAQKELRDRIVKAGLSVRQAEELARRMKEASGSQPKTKKEVDPDIEFLSNRLSEIVGATVRVVPGKRGGKVEIRCRSRQQLEHLIELLTRLEREDS